MTRRTKQRTVEDAGPEHVRCTHHAPDCPDHCSCLCRIMRSGLGCGTAPEIDEQLGLFEATS